MPKHTLHRRRRRLREEHVSLPTHVTGEHVELVNGQEFRVVTYADERVQLAPKKRRRRSR